MKRIVVPILIKFLGQNPTPPGILRGEPLSLFKRPELSLILLLLCFATLTTSGQPKSTSPVAPFDVIHYDAQVEPDIAHKRVRGKVLIRFIARANNLSAIELDCGDLTVEAVREGRTRQKFAVRDHRLSISLSRPAKRNDAREITIEYHGEPRRGIRFFPEREQVYTVFSTSQWMICVDAPDDKATLSLDLILPAGLQIVAPGRLVAKRGLPNGKIAYEWRQATPVPTYTFGFAAGRFRTLTERRGHVQLRYLAEHFSDEELRRIFRETAAMISFYEDRAGVLYNDASYAQVLAAGDVGQEMSSFTVMGDGYGREVLADEHAVWLAAHELAHQWWGNMVTCRDWNHFWLNEGMANFMAAAYREHRFGRKEYEREIEASRANYEKVREAGKDRSLVFPDWLHPTSEDRTLVYDKGSYVLHLLRIKLGERAFWTGIRQYTRTYFGKSVTTIDFQRSMEQASGTNLTEFFDQWVYLKKR